MSGSKRPEPKRRITGRKCLKVTGQIAGTVCAVAPVAYSAFVGWPIGPVAEKLLGFVALALLAFHVVNTRTRVRLGHWRVERLRPKLYREIFFGWAVPIGIALAALLLPASPEVLLGIGVAFAVSWTFYEPLQEKIRKIVAAEGLEQGTDLYKTRRPFKKILDVEDDIGQIAEGDHGPGPQKLLGALSKPPWRPGLSRTRTVIVVAMAIGFAVAWIAAGQAALREALKPPPAITKHRKGGSRKTRDDSAGGGGKGRADEPETTEFANDEETCRFPPARGAPAWARDKLNALYYGGEALNANPPPGNIGGCTEKAVVVGTPHGDFVYTIGHNRIGEVRSVAVTSHEFGPAIFLAPAAKNVIDLIRHKIVPLGGYPTKKVVEGDTTAVTTPQGTFALVRNATHLPGMPNFAAPYVELPPTVASAWFGAMRERNAWLWPQPPSANDLGREFTLTADSGGLEVEYTVKYDPSGGAAQRDRYRYDLPEPQLEQGEFERYATTAK
ncbi:MAG TPA: hypothetical protein VGN84_11185 [Solirubrobacterales bacterium]|nr:hypothetical protein [Solirubrobacterales bacterium]